MKARSTASGWEGLTDTNSSERAHGRAGALSIGRVPVYAASSLAVLDDLDTAAHRPSFAQRYSRRDDGAGPWRTGGRNRAHGGGDSGRNGDGLHRSLQLRKRAVRARAGRRVRVAGRAVTSRGSLQREDHKP